MPSLFLSLPLFPTTHEQNMAKRNQPFNPKDMHLLKYGVEGDEPVIMTGWEEERMENEVAKCNLIKIIIFIH